MEEHIVDGRTSDVACYEVFQDGLLRLFYC